MRLLLAIVYSSLFKYDNYSRTLYFTIKREKDYIRFRWSLIKLDIHSIWFKIKYPGDWVTFTEYWVLNITSIFNKDIPIAIKYFRWDFEGDHFHTPNGRVIRFYDYNRRRK